jgi:hypothetical protein
MTAAIVTSAFPISRPHSVEGSCLLTLLVIGQDHPLREVYREAGSALGYATSTVDTPEEALYLIDSQTVDVVLLDVKPPVFADSKPCAASEPAIRGSKLSW